MLPCSFFFSNGHDKQMGYESNEFADCRSTGIRIASHLRLREEKGQSAEEVASKHLTRHRFSKSYPIYKDKLQPKLPKGVHITERNIKTFRSRLRLRRSI